MKISNLFLILMTTFGTLNTHAALLPWGKLPLNTTHLFNNPNPLTNSKSQSASNKKTTFSQAWRFLVSDTDPVTLSVNTAYLDVANYITNSFTIKIDNTLVGELVMEHHNGIFSSSDILKTRTHKKMGRGGLLAKQTNAYELSIDLMAIPVPATIWLFGSAAIALFKLIHRKKIDQPLVDNALEPLFWSSKFGRF